MVLIGSYKRTMRTLSVGGSAAMAGGSLLGKWNGGPHGIFVEQCTTSEDPFVGSHGCSRIDESVQARQE